jgi:hypothetical protein
MLQNSLCNCTNPFYFGFFKFILQGKVKTIFPKWNHSARAPSGFDLQKKDSLFTPGGCIDNQHGSPQKSAIRKRIIKNSSAQEKGS